MNAHNRISNIYSGGLMVNYFCSSSCRHCLYYSSPRWPKDYIEGEKAREYLKKIRDLGCYSLHIGGGEPLLRPEKLEAVITVFKDLGMGLDYVETNSSVFQTVEKTVAVLERLRKAGLDTLLISISPFHNEFVPLKKIEAMIAVCRKAGIGVFPWIEAFISDLSAFDPNTRHSLEDYEERFGPGYIKSIPNRYWVSFRGRALKTYSNYFQSHPMEKIISGESSGCRELFDTSHFHVDCYGRYIPGLCTGLAIELDELGEELDPSKYPILTWLMMDGIGSLLEYASSRYGFKPRTAYVSKCDLCEDIRAYLVLDREVDSPELHPRHFYIEKRRT